MIRFKDIHIPKPCSVDYDSLPGNDVKRFCDSCEKHVYDFRGKDEVYFNSIISTHGKVCGFFYSDEIQTTPLKNKPPFYYAVAAKIIGMLLFFKTLLSSDHAQAAKIEPNNIIQQSTDSTGIKVEFKKRPSQYSAYSMKIFINDMLYKSGSNLDNGTGFIWLPDSLKENDNIKIIVSQYDHTENNRLHPKSYFFKFKESEKITINVKYNKIHLFKRRRRSTGGTYL